MGTHTYKTTQHLPFFKKEKEHSRESWKEKDKKRRPNNAKHVCIILSLPSAKEEEHTHTHLHAYTCTHIHSYTHTHEKSVEKSRTTEQEMKEVMMMRVQW